MKMLICHLVLFVFVVTRFALCNICGKNAFCNEYDEILFDLETRGSAYANRFPLRNVTNGQTPRNVSNAACPSFADITNNTPFSRRSLSPWQWVRNVDANRIPEMIIESECLCTHCLSPRPTDQDEVQHSLMSVPIAIPRAVQLRQSDGTWGTSTIYTNVACRCDIFSIGDSTN